MTTLKPSRPQLLVDYHYDDNMAKVAFVLESDDGITPIQPQDVIDAICEFYLLHHQGDVKFTSDEQAH